MSIVDQPSALINFDTTELPMVPVRRFTVEEYHEMAKAGILDEDDRVELLEGWIVPKMVKNPRHATGIVLADEAIRALLRPGWRLRVQSAITTIESEPEPDLVIVQGSGRAWKDEHPTPHHLALVVEVADSSLAHDRRIKKRIYARAQAPCYWIVNLIDMQLEVYTCPSGPGPAPTYLESKNLRSNQSVQLMIGGEEWGTIRVADLLP